MIGCQLGINSVAARVADAAKSLELTVPGAVVVAPLRSSFSSYGSNRGTFALSGEPSLTTEGAYFDGVDDAAWLASGFSAAFTLVGRVRQLTFGGGALNGASMCVMNSRPGITGWNGWAYEQLIDKKYLLVNGIARIADGNKDADPHVVTLRRSAGTVYLYVDGAVVANGGGGNLSGDSLVLGASFQSAFSSFISCTIANIALYHSSLSDADRLSVEAWALT